MNLVKELLLQQFIVLVPFLAFNIYYRDKMQNYSRKFIIFTCVITLFLSMTFGHGVVTGFFYDSRFIIMFFGLVFGGLQTGVILLIEFILYRFYIGGVGIWPAMITMSIAFPFLVLVNKFYQRADRKSAVIVLSGLVISIVPYITIILIKYAGVTTHLLYHVLTIPFYHAISVWVLMSLFQRAVSNKELFIKYSRAERIEAISHVAASLVHEVRNPLTTVKGFLKLIRQSPFDRKKVEGYIDICTEEIERTESILSDYLALSKPKGEKREVVDLNHQIQVIIEVMKPYANMYNVHLYMQKAIGPVRILANHDKIKQILVNFVKNAIEACSNVPNGEVRLQLEVNRGNAQFTITDNGIGMNEDQVKRLGSIYYSTKINGTGLGLTYSYQVINEIGGSIKVHSIPQVGTEFTVTIPILKR